MSWYRLGAKKFRLRAVLIIKRLYWQVISQLISTRISIYFNWNILLLFTYHLNSTQLPIQSTLKVMHMGMIVKFDFLCFNFWLFSWVAVLVPWNLNNFCGTYFWRWRITLWVEREVSVNRLLERVGRASHMSGFGFPMTKEAESTMFLYWNTHPWYYPWLHLDLCIWLINLSLLGVSINQF